MQNRSPLLTGLSRNVIVLGLVSLFQDTSSEMLYPVVPMFLAGVLGAPMTVIGLIEGFAEFTAAILKAVFGSASDRVQRRSVFISLGYGLSAASRPLLFFANTWGLVLFSRLLDRLGKGVRTSPRDALLADSAPAEHRGKVFGLHRAMDTVGAVIGPLLAIWVLAISNNDYRCVFLIAIIPTALAFGLTFLVKEIETAKLKSDRAFYLPLATLPLAYWKFLAINTLFFIGNSSDVFLILRAQEIGLSAPLAILAYVVYNLAYALLATPAGMISDHLGRRRVMQIGFLAFAGVYLGFAFIKSTSLIWPLFALYGFYAAMTEGVSKAMVADLVAPAHRGSAIGVFYMSTGVAALVASSLAGWLWKEFGAAVALGFSAGTAVLAALAMGRWKNAKSWR
ncbi:MAG: MFS transporter [candidate division KSB1 bacterium]|nr:MFS transporter [candidate division KSB1 bacterium]MDZ7365834.1 MFS transporter [candidate division KSB1 bacterium]MDZ7403931.1 MFS transporter [candidate division KSB1 bacterium]